MDMLNKIKWKFYILDSFLNQYHNDNKITVISGMLNFGRLKIAKVRCFVNLA